MLTKQQAFVIAPIIGALAYDFRVARKNKKTYNALRESNIQLQTGIAQTYKSCVALASLVDYLSNLLENNEVEITEFDKIAISELTRIDKD